MKQGPISDVFFYFMLFSMVNYVKHCDMVKLKRWQGNSDIAFAFLFDAIICRIKIHFLVIMTSSDSVSISVISQDG